MNVIKRFSAAALTVMSMSLVAVNFSVVNSNAATPVYFSIDNGAHWDVLDRIENTVDKEQFKIAFSAFSNGSQPINFIIDHAFEKTCFIKVHVNMDGKLQTVAIEPQTKAVKQILSKEQDAKIKGSRPKGFRHSCSVLKPLEGNITQEEINELQALAKPAVHATPAPAAKFASTTPIVKAPAKPVIATGAPSVPKLIPAVPAPAKPVVIPTPTKQAEPPAKIAKTAAVQAPTAKTVAGPIANPAETLAPAKTKISTDFPAEDLAVLPASEAKGRETIKPVVITDGASTSAQAEASDTKEDKSDGKDENKGKLIQDKSVKTVAQPESTEPDLAERKSPSIPASETKADDNGKEPLEPFDGNDHGDMDPLLEAVITNQPFAIIQKLISAGANPNVQEAATQKAPLHYAIENENKFVVQLLLKSPGINVNIQDSDKNTPLHLAAKIGNLPIVKLLLQAPNINILARNNKGETSLKIATGCKHGAVAHLLIRALGQFIIRKLAASLWHVAPKITSIGIPIGLATLLAKSYIGEGMHNISDEMRDIITWLGRAKIAIPYTPWASHALEVLDDFSSEPRNNQAILNDRATLKDTDNEKCSIALDRLIENDPRLDALTAITQALSLNPSTITIRLGEDKTSAGYHITPAKDSSIKIARNFNKCHLTLSQKTGVLGHELCHIHDKPSQKKFYATDLVPLLVDGAYIGKELFLSSIPSLSRIVEHLASRVVPRTIISYGLGTIINHFMGRYYEKKADTVSARLSKSAQALSDYFYNTHLLTMIIRPETWLRKYSEFIDVHPSDLDRAHYLANIAIHEQSFNQQDLMLYNPALTKTKMSAGEPNFTLYTDAETMIDVNEQDGTEQFKSLQALIPIDAHDGQHRTALMYAIVNRDITTIRRLLQEGYSINHHDINAWTPLHWAAALGNPYIMQALLIHGARQEAKNNAFQCPSDIAQKLQHDEAIKLLAISRESQRNTWEQLFALSQAHHRRLGEDSPVALLPRNDLLLYIGTLVKQANLIQDLAGYPEHEDQLWHTLQEAIARNKKDTVQSMLNNNTVTRPSEAFQYATQCKNYDIANMLEPHATIKRDFDRYLHALQ